MASVLGSPSGGADPPRALGAAGGGADPPGGGDDPLPPLPGGGHQDAGGAEDEQAEEKKRKERRPTPEWLRRERRRSANKEAAQRVAQKREQEAPQGQSPEEVPQEEAAQGGPSPQGEGPAKWPRRQDRATEGARAEASAGPSHEAALVATGDPVTGLIIGAAAAAGVEPQALINEYIRTGVLPPAARRFAMSAAAHVVTGGAEYPHGPVDLEGESLGPRVLHEPALQAKCRIQRAPAVPSVGARALSGSSAEAHAGQRASG